MDFDLYLTRHVAAPQPVEQLPGVKPKIGPPYVMYPIICLPIGEIKAGDVISIPAAYCQVSSQMPYYLMVGSWLTLHDHPHSVATAGLDGWGDFVEVSEATTTNITQIVHHHPVRQSGHITVPRDIEDAYLIFWVYAASSAYDGTSVLTVDQDYGRLEGAVYRKATAADLLALLGDGVPAPAPPAPAPAPVPAPEPEPEPEPQTAVSIVLTPEQVSTVVAQAAAPVVGNGTFVG